MMTEKELIDFLFNDKSNLPQEEQVVQIITESSETSITSLIEIKQLQEMLTDIKAAERRHEEIINALSNQ